MVNLSDEAKAFIKDNKNLIDSGNFEFFLDSCYSYWQRRWQQNQYAETLNFLYNDCGIDFFQYIETLPPLLNFTADTLIIPENITRFGACFTGFTNLNVKKLIFNANVRSLPDGMFSRMENVKSIEINSPNLSRLPDRSFKGDYSLEKIYLNSPIKRIGNGSIDYCNQLKAIVCNRDVQLRLPSNELDKYKPILKAKKVKVQESLVLTEAYSSSMPQWLRKWLDKPQCKGYKQRLINRGIDLSKAKFISVAPSALKKSQENRVKEPNIAFWDLSAIATNESSMVCAKGINDDNCGVWNISDHYFKYWPLKLLVANASNFCYVDTSDPENLYDMAQRNNNRIEREERWKKGIEKVPDNIKNSSVFSIDNSVFSIDKSGYIIRRAANRFADALKEAKAKNYQKTLDKVKSQLLEYKDYIVSEMRDILSEQNQNSLEIGVNLSRFGEIMDVYNSLVNTFDKESNMVFSLANQYEGQELLKRMNQQIFDSYAWGRFVSDLNSFKKNYIPQLVNWQLPEYDEED